MSPRGTTSFLAERNNGLGTVAKMQQRSFEREKKENKLNRYERRIKENVPKKS
ncbi:36010_t:CDS:1, partial [Racocetra persica]